MTASTLHPRLHEAFSWADARLDDHLRRLCDYLTRPTVSAGADSLAPGAAWLAAWLEELGFATWLGGAPTHPLVMAARRAGTPGRRTVLLYGHYDVQPAGPMAEWTRGPFAPWVADGRVIARGAADNKGQHFAQLVALEALLASGDELPCDVVVVLDGEEEIGSPHLAEAVREHRDFLHADLVVATDGPRQADGRVRLIAGCRGVVSFDLSTATARNDLHSGNWGGVAPDAAWELVHALAALRAPDGRLTVPGLEPPARLHADLQRRAAALPVALDEVRAAAGITRLAPPEDRPLHERLMAWPALSVNALAAGPADFQDAGPAIRARAAARCDLRLVPGQDPDEALTSIAAHLAAVAPGVELRPLGTPFRPALSPLDGELIGRLVDAVAVAQGEAPCVEPVAGGSLPLAAWSEELGCPAYVVAHANHDCRAHGPDENLTIDAFAGCVRTGIATLLSFGDAA